MKLYSTNNPKLRVDFAEAVFQALPGDGGLYMPEHLSVMPDEFWRKLPDFTLTDIAVEVSAHLLADELSRATIERRLRRAINFDAPLVPIAGRSPEQYILELFHGPSMAFKDFGARFMSEVMEELLSSSGRRIKILVATSGDTGGAVAAGFHGNENVEVLILYPRGGVSEIQEAQLTTLGGNVKAFRVAGTFDDCQRLVKQAFTDTELRSRVDISSANSINILRLIPQTFYYLDAYRQWLTLGHRSAPVFSVPSGNFGNLTAGVIAHQLGMPVRRFIAATNANDTVVRYASTGDYAPRPSVKTLSNAMDVGSPSNFPRLQQLLGSTWNAFRDKIYAVSFDDRRTEQELVDVYASTQLATTSGYVLDPHTAVGTLALQQYQKEVEAVPGIVLGTAHAGKFQPDVERILGQSIQLPDALQRVKSLPQEVTDLPNDYAAFRQHIH